MRESKDQSLQQDTQVLQEKPLSRAFEPLLQLISQRTARAESSQTMSVPQPLRELNLFLTRPLDHRLLLLPELRHRGLLVISRSRALSYSP